MNQQQKNQFWNQPGFKVVHGTWRGKLDLKSKKDKSEEQLWNKIENTTKYSKRKRKFAEQKHDSTFRLKKYLTTKTNKLISSSLWKIGVC